MLWGEVTVWVRGDLLLLSSLDDNRAAVAEEEEKVGE